MNEVQPKKRHCKLGHKSGKKVESVAYALVERVVSVGN